MSARALGKKSRVPAKTQQQIYHTSYTICHMSNTTLVKTRRVGGSLVVTLPKEVTESRGIKEGENIEITVKKLHVDGFGAHRGIGPLNAEDELKVHE